MPLRVRYQVEARYTNSNALKTKLKRMFPNSRSSDFEIKVGRREICC